MQILDIEGVVVVLNLIVANGHFGPDTAFQPPPGMSLEEFLLNGSDDWWGANDYRGNLIGTSTLSVVIDGESLSGLEVYRANSSLFTFTADPALAEIFDPCITGTPQEGV